MSRSLVCVVLAVVFTFFHANASVLDLPVVEGVDTVLLDAGKKPDTDTPLAPDGKPVFANGKKVRQDAGELDPQPSVKTNVPSPRVTVVTFVGKKHVRRQPNQLGGNFTPPIVYDDRIIMREARTIFKDVISEYPDRIHNVGLSDDASCVDKDPYFPGYRNPAGLKNPTPLRKIARKFAADAAQHAGTVGDIHVGAKILGGAPISELLHHETKMLDKEADSQGPKSKLDHESVKLALEATSKIADELRVERANATEKGLENLKAQIAKVDAN